MDLARLNLSKAHYLKKQLSALPGVTHAFSSPFFNEFVIKVEKDPQEILQGLTSSSILGGIALNRFYPELSKHILLCATEMNPKHEMDRFVRELSSFTGG
jgi:glycine dehydrogenase subunit 1